MLINKNLKLIILAGGKGSRISEYSKTIPKPMIKVAGIPIIVHIINIYKSYGVTKFYIALGYKGHLIKKFFNFTNIKKHKLNNIELNFVNTGLNTMTGGRLKRFKKYLINDDHFMFTYGDGVADINITKLIKFHFLKKKLLTVTAVKPPSRFGSLNIANDFVTYFKEKAQSDAGWINGGFFIANTKILNFIKGDDTYFEREPMELIAQKRQLVAYKHNSFWQCMDTLRDKEYLDNILKNNSFLKNKI
jgi:glucose-1-phosphate cytidylyltransferase|tara:strand:+ start:426 stop:1166 length:741 start_codon:yes stop_codon:yes gene_type:complete